VSPEPLFAGSTSHVLAGVLFVALLLAACVTDVRARRIPNALVLVLAACGLAYSAISGPFLPGVGRAVAGMAVGLGIWLPLYALRMIGAGDVKLFAGAAAWLGPGLAAWAALLSALLGGVLAIVALVLSSGLGLTVLRVRHAVVQPETLRDGSITGSTASGRRLPYALALAAGLVIVAWYPGVLR
jgi:prepilin peptidase CpaA